MATGFQLPLYVDAKEFLGGQDYARRTPAHALMLAKGRRQPPPCPVWRRHSSVDADGNDENHPKFDHTSVRSGRLYPKPALFFGMKDARGCH
jgi:hypothetical protein